MSFIQRQPVEDYINQVVNVYEFLCAQTDLSPRNAGVNAILSTFVANTMKPRPQDEIRTVLEAPVIKEIAPELRRLLGRAEYEMECFCAMAFTGQETGTADEHYTSFANFIYMQNYEALIENELKGMGWPTKQPPLDRQKESVAFVGAGPLPISAILLHLRTGLPVTCIDSDERACALGRNLIRHLASTDPAYATLAQNMGYAHAPGDRYDYVTHPIVFVASLVDRKDPVIMRVLTTSDTAATMVIRSAEGLSTLLYEPHDCIAGLEEYNMYFSRKVADSEAVNSSLVYKLPPGKLRMRNKIEFHRQQDMEILDQRPRPMWRTSAKNLLI